MMTQENIPYTADEIKAMVKTIEELRKKYNAALEIAREIFNSEFKPDDAMVLAKHLSMIFPELIEDEDERIRKAIIALIEFGLEDKSAIAPGHNVIKEDAIAWLEKQKERQSIWTDSDRTMVFTLLRDVDQMTYISNEGKNERLQWLNSLEDKFNNGE